MKVRLKPVDVEVIQYTGDNDAEVAEFVGMDAGDAVVVKEELKLENDDWVIQGAGGNFFSVTPDVFAVCYEPIN